MQLRPVTYRSEIVGPLLAALSASECCSVVGMSGVGKTNVIGQIQRSDVQQHYLGGAPPICCVLLDVNMLVAQDGWGLLEGLLEALGSEAVADAELRAVACAAHAQVLRAPGNTVLALRQVGDVLAWACARTRVALIFDEFDAIYGAIESGVLRNLRGLRDRHKYRLTMVTFTRQPLVDLREDDWDAIEPFVELLTLHELGLHPLSAADSRDEVARIAGRYGQAVPAAALEPIATLSGGHPALIRALVRLALDTPDLLKAAPAKLAAHPTLRLECAKIWQQLDGDEQDDLRALSLGKRPGTPDDLLLKGLVRGDARSPTIFSPLLAHYITQVDGRAAPGAPTLQVDLERNQIHYYGQEISGRLTRLERKVITYLWQHDGVICPLAEVAEAVYGDEFRAAAGTTRLERSDELERLRVLARRLARHMEQLTPPGSPSLFSIHRMRGLRLGLPAAMIGS